MVYDCIVIDLENKTIFTIEINWDNTALIDRKQNFRKIVHQGTKVTSIIPPKSKLKDYLIPSNNISHLSSGWSYSNLLEYGDNQKMFSLLIPLKLTSITNEYVFTFKIN